MKKLLLMLSLIFLTSPALANDADPYILEHGKSYTDAIVSCASKTDVMGLIHAITSESGGRPNLDIATENNNCVFQVQHFVYLKEDYVCGFNVVYSSFTLLNTEVEGIKQYIVVYAYAPITLTNNIRPLQCIQERQPN